MSQVFDARLVLPEGGPISHTALGQFPDQAWRPRWKPSETEDVTANVWDVWIKKYHIVSQISHNLSKFLREKGDSPGFSFWQHGKSCRKRMNHSTKSYLYKVLQHLPTMWFIVHSKVGNCVDVDVQIQDTIRTSVKFPSAIGAMATDLESRWIFHVSLLGWSFVASAILSCTLANFAICLYQVSIPVGNLSSGMLGVIIRTMFSIIHSSFQTKSTSHAWNQLISHALGSFKRRSLTLDGRSPE